LHSLLREGRKLLDPSFGRKFFSIFSNPCRFPYNGASSSTRRKDGEVEVGEDRRVPGQRILKRGRIVVFLCSGRKKRGEVKIVREKRDRRKIYQPLPGLVCERRGSDFLSLWRKEGKWGGYGKGRTELGKGFAHPPEFGMTLRDQGGNRKGGSFFDFKRFWGGGLSREEACRGIRR